MSQRARRRRRLQREANAILYRVLDADFARRRLPPDVLAQMTLAACHRCRAAVLAHTPVLELMQQAARKSGQELLLICHPCARVVLGGAAHTELHLIDPGLKARLDQWTNEAN